MNKVIRFLALLVIMLIVYSCFSTRKHTDPSVIVLPLSDTVTLSEGSIVYGLPRTVFTFVVKLERTIEIPGPYAKYAGDLLGLTDVIQEENEHWSIEEISVISSEELDPSEFYIIKSNTLFQTNVLVLKKEGLILDLNPVIFNTAECKTDVSGTVPNQFRSFDLGSDEYFHLDRDTAYKRVNIDSTFIRIPYIVEKRKRLQVEQLAEKAAKRLMEMREGKHLILTGEANVFPQDNAPINEMNRLEKEYTELFAGKVINETRTFTCQIIPAKEMIGKRQLLFAFSELTGPSSGNSEGGKSVMIEFIPDQKTKELTILNKTQAAPFTPVYDKLYYRVPDVVELKITHGSEVLLNSRRLVFQFGELTQLPANYIIGK